MDDRNKAGLLALQAIRDVAVTSLTDALSTKFTEQAVELHDAREDVKRLGEEISRLRTENTELNRRLAEHEPDTPSL